MDILGVGAPEFFIILILSFMILGPRRFPHYAAKAGKLFRDLRNMSQGLMTEWQREIAVAARLDELEQTRKELQEAQKMLRDTGQTIKAEGDQASKDVAEAMDETSKAVAESGAQAKAMAEAAVAAKAAETTTEANIPPTTPKTAQSNGIYTETDAASTETNSPQVTSSVEAQQLPKKPDTPGEDDLSSTSNSDVPPETPKKEAVNE